MSDAIERDFAAACLKAVTPLVQRLRKAEARVEALRRVLGEPTRTSPSPRSPRKTSKPKANGGTKPGRVRRVGKPVISEGREYPSLQALADHEGVSTRVARHRLKRGLSLKTSVIRGRQRETGARPAQRRDGDGDGDKGAAEAHPVAKTRPGIATMVEWNGERRSLNGWCQKLGYTHTDAVRLRVDRNLPLTARIDSHSAVDSMPTERALRRRELWSSGPPALKLDPLYGPLPSADLLTLTADSMVEGRRVRDWAQERGLLVHRVLARLRGGQSLDMALGPTVQIESQLLPEDLYGANRYGWKPC